MIKQSDLFKRKEDCCGCELCSLVCPKQVLRMKPDKEGFLYPFVEQADACIECKRCLTVCPLKKSVVDSKNLIESFGGYSKNIEDIKYSSSGGLATVLSRYIISIGGVVYGVKYSDDCLSALFARAESKDELDAFRTSKYIQAKKGSIYKSIKEDVQAGLKTLVIGLPCEISAIYNYLRKDYDNLYTVSLICHGPTSSKVHYDFCTSLTNKYKSNIKYISVRHKKKGWKPYYIKVIFDNEKIYLKQFRDTNYEIAFQYLKRPSCSSCPFKYSEKDNGIKSDLVIGDFHMAHKGMEQFNKWGSSQVSVFSYKGNHLISSIKSEFNMYAITREQATNNNIAFIKPIQKKKGRQLFSEQFVYKSLDSACNKWVIRYPVIKRRVINAFKDLFRPLYKTILRVIH